MRMPDHVNRRAAIPGSVFVLVALTGWLAAGIPAAAKSPQSAAGGGELANPGVLELTPEQQAALPGKLAALQHVMGVTTLAPGVVSATSTDNPPATATLPLYARHQRRWFYCGPATVQVISNASWGYYSSSTDGQSSATNKYTQSTISANWTKTDSNLQTNLGDLITGLNSASRRPSGFVYVQMSKPSWDTFHNAIITDVWHYGMGLAAHVNPNKTGSTYHLYSWKNVAPGDYGHYIPLRGYSGFTQSTALAYYDDSSGGRDEVTGQVILGATGAFSDPSYTVYMTMMNRYGNLVW